MAMVGARTPKDAEAAISESIPWCKAETPKDGRFEPAPEDWPRCERVGPYGARYALRNPNIGEWTSDTECMQEAPAPPEPVLILLSRPRLEGIASVTTEGGEFRCVW
jgi:hypothetical protein